MQNTKIVPSDSVILVGISKEGFRVGLSCPTTFQKEKYWKLDLVSNKGNQNAYIFEIAATLILYVN